MKIRQFVLRRASWIGIKRVKGIPTKVIFAKRYVLLNVYSLTLELVSTQGLWPCCDHHFFFKTAGYIVQARLNCLLLMQLGIAIVSFEEN